MLATDRGVNDGAESTSLQLSEIVVSLVSVHHIAKVLGKLS